MLLKMPGFLGIQHGSYDPDSVLEEELGAFDGRLRDGDAETAALLLRSAVSIRWRVDPDTVNDARFLNMKFKFSSPK